jgi:hypothetical protein
MTFQKAKTDISTLPALHKIDGAIAAALVSSGIGCFVIGVMTTAAEASDRVASMLNWWGPVGPLSGKTGVGLIAWIVGWMILHYSWKERETSLGTALTVSLILIGLGFLLTFPPFFDLFA